MWLQVLWHILRPGGFVINAGPLLFHWAQADDDAEGSNAAEVSIELSLADVRAAACGIGFAVLEESEAQMQYLADRQGLYQTTYTGVRWVLQKVEAVKPGMGEDHGVQGEAAAQRPSQERAAAREGGGAEGADGSCCNACT